MHRLFVAVDLPEQVKEKIAGIVHRGLTGARWVPGEQLHLTLRFIGDADDRMFQEIRRGLSRVTVAPFSLSLKGIGHFPPRGGPRVLWVGVEVPVELGALQERIEDEVVKTGIEAERRRFSPHITVARLKEISPARVSQLEEKNREFSAGPFPVDEFYLYSSILTGEGAIHKREAVYRLQSLQTIERG
jgi:2'-5' RNA ligase